MSDNLDLNVTKEVLDNVIEHIKDEEICGLKNHTFDMYKFGMLTQCGTVACLYGTGYLLVNGKLTNDGPSQIWRNLSSWHTTVYWLFYQDYLTADEVKIVYKNIYESGDVNFVEIHKQIRGSTYQILEENYNDEFFPEEEEEEEEEEEDYYDYDDEYYGGW